MSGRFLPNVKIKVKLFLNDEVLVLLLFCYMSAPVAVLTQAYAYCDNLAFSLGKKLVSFVLNPTARQ